MTKPDYLDDIKHLLARLLDDYEIRLSGGEKYHSEKIDFTAEVLFKVSQKYFEQKSKSK